MSNKVATNGQGSSPAGFYEFGYAGEPVTNGDPATADHNPSPSML